MKIHFLKIKLLNEIEKGKAADMTVVQQIVTDSLNMEGKLQKVIAVYRMMYPSIFIKS